MWQLLERRLRVEDCRSTNDTVVSKTEPKIYFFSATYGSVAGSVKTQSRFLTGVWQVIQTFAPF